MLSKSTCTPPVSGPSHHRVRCARADLSQAAVAHVVEPASGSGGASCFSGCRTVDHPDADAVAGGRRRAEPGRRRQPNGDPPPGSQAPEGCAAQAQDQPSAGRHRRRVRRQLAAAERLQHHRRLRPRVGPGAQP